MVSDEKIKQVDWISRILTFVNYLQAERLKALGCCLFQARYEIQPNFPYNFKFTMKTKTIFSMFRGILTQLEQEHHGGTFKWKKKVEGTKQQKYKWSTHAART